MSNEYIKQFESGCNYRIADWGGSQNSICIEYDVEGRAGENETGFFFAGASFELFLDVLKDESLTQSERDLIIKGILRGIRYARSFINAWDCFVWTE